MTASTSLIIGLVKGSVMMNFLKLARLGYAVLAIALLSCSERCDAAYIAVTHGSGEWHSERGHVHGHLEVDWGRSDSLPCRLDFLNNGTAQTETLGLSDSLGMSGNWTGNGDSWGLLATTGTPVDSSGWFYVDFTYKRSDGSVHSLYAPAIGGSGYGCSSLDAWTAN